MKTTALSLAITLLHPLAALASEPALPAPAGPAHGPQLTASELLLDPGTVPPEAISRQEPPVLARPDARTFTYGEEVPRVRCVPYRVCTLLFAPDETVLEFALGDSERWQLQLFDSGSIPTIVYKPKAFNLLSNLVVQTDRRLYSIELVAPTAPEADPRSSDISYDALTRFTYPGDWTQSASAPPPEPPSASKPPASDPAPSEPADLHFAYEFDRPLWRPHRLGWTPDVVYDDGERTYIHLPPKARHDLPAVLLIDEAGEPSPTDASLSGPASEWLVVPIVAEKLRLVRGSDDATRRLTIIRRGS